MPLDPSIFYNFAALRAQQDQSLQNQISDIMKRRQEAKNQGVFDVEKNAERAAYDFITTGNMTPEGFGAIRTLDALNAGKTSYVPNPDGSGSLIPVPRPSLEQSLFGGKIPQTMAGGYQPAYPSLGEMMPTAPGPEGVSMEQIQPIDMSQLTAPMPRIGATMPPQGLTPQQDSALKSRANVFIDEAPALPTIQAPAGASPKTRQQAQEAGIDVSKSLAIEAGKKKMEREARASEPLNIEQGKIATFADRLIQADKIISPLSEAQTSLAQRGLGGLPLGNFMTTEDFKKASQAERNFVNAVLRRESGAVISKEEFDNARQQYFPQPGDTSDIITQKAANRQTVIDGFIREAGPSYSPKKIQANIPEGAKMIGTSGGKKVYQLIDGTYVKEK